MKFFLFLFIIILLSNSVFAAHFIVGYVNDAQDGTSANGRTVYLWNPVNGVADNVTDIVGSTGNSGADNFYLIDCELLSTPCNIGDEIRVRIQAVDGYSSNFVNVSITGGGFDVMANLSLNSPPLVYNVSVDDAFSNPAQEIDLTPLANTSVLCTGIIGELDGNETISNVSAQLFSSNSSSFNSADDYNLHYTNSSCSIDQSFGNSTTASFSCGFDLAYYSIADHWNCSVSSYDNVSALGFESNYSIINPLAALSVTSNIGFGTVDLAAVTSEVPANVTNAGNVFVNLSLSGYARSFGDNFSHNCTFGYNISIENMQYNLTGSNESNLTFDQFDSLYQNLSSVNVVNQFNLAYRINDSDDEYLESTNTTYWRLYVPSQTSGNCTGNVIFGASMLPAS